MAITLQDDLFGRIMVMWRDRCHKKTNRCLETVYSLKDVGSIIAQGVPWSFDSTNWIILVGWVKFSWEGQKEVFWEGSKVSTPQNVKKTKLCFNGRLHIQMNPWIVDAPLGMIMKMATRIEPCAIHPFETDRIHVARCWVKFCHRDGWISVGWFPSSYLLGCIKIKDFKQGLVFSCKSVIVMCTYVN